jgi:L-lysine 6-transaminase
MCAIDLSDGGVRDDVVRRLRTEEQVIALPCGPWTGSSPA